ncbi:MAG: hypothetical protein LZF86_110791 [Nitrospira sp.]|nr:MAG: hypothetical protein LZF86_110791 [Nitrospira sp.]
MRTPLVVFFSIRLALYGNFLGSCLLACYASMAGGQLLWVSNEKDRASRSAAPAGCSAAHSRRHAPCWTSAKPASRSKAACL